MFGPDRAGRPPGTVHPHRRVHRRHGPAAADPHPGRQRRRQRRPACPATPQLRRAPSPPTQSPPTPTPRRRQRLEDLRQQGPPRPHLRTVLRRRLRLPTRPDRDVLATLAAAIQHYDPRGRPTVTDRPRRQPDPRRLRHASRSRTTPRSSPRPRGRPTPTTPTTTPAAPTPRSPSNSPTQWNTPASTLIDALGRTVQTVQRGLDADVVTTSGYDIDGHLTAVVDPLGRPCAGDTSTTAPARRGASWLLDAGTDPHHP